MTRHNSHRRLLAFPANQTPAGGRVDALRAQSLPRGSDLVLDYHELQLSNPPNLFERDGKPWEQVQGVYHPRRLRFTGVQIIDGGDLCVSLTDMPADYPGRTLTSTLAWRTPAGQKYFLFSFLRDTYSPLLLIARHCVEQAREGVTQAIESSRDWSPVPLSPTRVVPNPGRMHERFGGDPVTLQLNGRVHHRRLFIGGTDIQGEDRPDIDVVLNLGEVASRWTRETQPYATDRWDNKGEGSQGMDASEIADEARWVIERLQANKRVLVHCAAGMNRSATICCAVVMLLEGISAEDALVRVREHHPWAKPDSCHWLALRWLDYTINRAGSETIE